MGVADREIVSFLSLADSNSFSWIRSYEKTNDLLHFGFESTGHRFARVVTPQLYASGFVPDLLFLKKDVFVDVCHQTLTGNIGSGGQLLVGGVLFHLGDIADTFLGKPLNLSIINVSSVHG